MLVHCAYDDGTGTPIRGGVAHVQRDGDGVLAVAVVAVVVTGVDDYGGVLCLFLQQFFLCEGDGLGIVVRLASASAENEVRMFVATASNLVALVREAVRGLRGHDAVHADFNVAARGVLHAYGHVQAGGVVTVLLILGAARAHGRVT